MVKAVDILRLVLENSKGRAHAPGEVKTPSYDNIHTPDNHKRKSREVRAKGLGDRPARKNVKQTEKPKGMVDNGGPAAPVKMKESDEYALRGMPGSTREFSHNFNQGNSNTKFSGPSKITYEQWKNTVKKLWPAAQFRKDSVHGDSFIHEGKPIANYNSGGVWVKKPGFVEARTAGAKRRYGQGNNENQDENAIDDGNDDPRAVQETRGKVGKPSTKKHNQTQDRPKKPAVKVQEGVTDAVAEFLMKMSGPKVGQKLYADLKTERPDLYQQLVQTFKRMAVGTGGVGVVHDATAFKNMMNDPEAVQLARQLRRWAAGKLRNSPEIVAWLQQKAEKLNAKGLSTVDPLGGDDEEELRDAVGSPSQYRPGLGESALMGRETIRIVLKLLNAGLMNAIYDRKLGMAARQIMKNPNDLSRIEPAMQIMQFVRNNAKTLSPELQAVLNQNVMPKVAESSKTSKSAPGEMRKPAVKTDAPAKSASMRSGSLTPEKKVPVRDKKPALNKDAAEFVRVSVKKVEEGVKALAAMGFQVQGLKK